MQPRSVSVVIPTNRGGPYLAEAVASVRAQTVAVREIILVDDGSPHPGLGAVAAELGLSYRRQHPSGLSVARNSGAAAATGEWLAFLDDDDVWHPERLARQFAALDDDPTAVAVSTGGWYMDADGVPFGDGWPSPRAASRDLLRGAVPFPRITTLLIRRGEYLAAGGCRSAMEPSEDNELILRLLQRGEFAAVDAALVGYRRHRDNVTRRGLAGRVASRRAVLEQLCAAKHADDGELSDLLRQNLRASRHDAAAQNLGEFIDAWRARDRTYARKTAWFAVRWAPWQSLGAVARRASSSVRRRMGPPDAD